MFFRIAFALACVSLLAIAGCPQPSTVAQMTNNADSTVRVRVYYSSEQEVGETVLEEFGQRVEFDLAPGETQSISRDCDDLQAILVEGELRLIGNIGPEETSRVYRDGSDFGCGDLVRFSFTQSALGTDLNISFNTN